MDNTTNNQYWTNVLNRNAKYGYYLQPSEVADVVKVTKRKFTQLRGNATYITYELTAHMKDGSKKSVTEVGPYKFLHRGFYANKADEAQARSGALLEATDSITEFLAFRDQQVK
jgi:hypothetical protein